MDKFEISTAVQSPELGNASFNELVEAYNRFLRDAPKRNAGVTVITNIEREKGQNDSHYYSIRGYEVQPNTVLLLRCDQFGKLHASTIPWEPVLDLKYSVLTKDARNADRP